MQVKDNEVMPTWWWAVYINCWA